MQIKFTKQGILRGSIFATFLVLCVILCNDITFNKYNIFLFAWAIITGLSISPDIRITNKKITIYAIYSVFAVAVVLGATLCLTENLWYDEGYTAALVSSDFPTILDITSNDVHTPFYYILAKSFYLLFGGNIQGLKICSLFFYLLYLLLGVFPIRKEFGDKISFYFLFFSTFIPSFIVHATNARMYTAAIFFVTATGIVALKIYRKSTATNWLFFVILSVCSVYIHTFSLISTVIIHLFLLVYLIKKKQKKQLLFFFCSAVLVSMSFIPWLGILWKQFQNRQGASDLVTMTTYDVIDFWAEWFSSYDHPQTMSLLFYLILVIGLLYHAIDAIRQKQYLSVLCGFSVFLITTVIGVFLSVRVTPCYLGRYSFSAFGFLCLVLALGISRIKSSRIVLPLAITVIALGLLQYKDSYELDNDPGLQVYKDFVQQNISPEDGIVYTEQHTQYLSVYYPDFTNFVYGNKSDLNPFANSEAYTSYEQLDSLDGKIWYVAFKNDTTHPMGDHYASELKLSFHYMYYDFDVFLLTPIDNL